MVDGWRRRPIEDTSNFSKLSISKVYHHAGLRAFFDQLISAIPRNHRLVDEVYGERNDEAIRNCSDQ